MVKTLKGEEVRRVQVYLLQARKEAGLTQAELANLLGISTTSYGDKERGIKEFTQDEMFFLSKFFNKNLQEIFLPRKSPKREQC